MSQTDEPDRVDRDGELERRVLALVARLRSDVEVHGNVGLAQGLLTAGVMLFSRAAAHSDHAVSPFVDPDSVSQTDVATSATAMLRATDIELFQLALWRAWGEPRGQ